MGSKQIITDCSLPEPDRISDLPSDLKTDQESKLTLQTDPLDSNPPAGQLPRDDAPTPLPNQFKMKRKRDSPSSSSVASSSDSPRPGKMSLNFLNDIPWTMEMDIILFGQLKKARTQQDDYLGLSWNDEKLWQQICSKVKAEAPLICDLDEIKDRVENYKSCYKQYGDDVFRGNFELQMLGKDVFDKSKDILSLSQFLSRTTSHSGQLSIGVSTARGNGNTSQSHEDALYEAVASLDEVKKRGDEFLADCMFKLVDKSLDKAFLSLRNDAQRWAFLKNVAG